MSSSGEFLSVRGYAKHRKCSHTAVSKAIAAGRLLNAVHRKEGAGRGQKVLIDPAVADSEWEQNTNPAQKRKEGTKLAPRETLFDEGPLPDPVASEATGPSSPSPARTQARAQAVMTSYKAQLTKLEFQQRDGSLVLVDEVELEAFRVARTIRNALLNIPERIASDLAADVDPSSVRNKLVAELNIVLGGLSDARLRA